MHSKQEEEKLLQHIQNNAATSIHAAAYVLPQILSTVCRVLHENDLHPSYVQLAYVLNV